MFERTGGLWSQRTKLTASAAASGDEFGTSVSQDEGWIAIGAPGEDNEGLSLSGSVVVLQTGPESPP